MLASRSGRACLESLPGSCLGPRRPRSRGGAGMGECFRSAGQASLTKSDRVVRNMSFQCVCMRQYFCLHSTQPTAYLGANALSKMMGEGQKAGLDSPHRRSEGGFHIEQGCGMLCTHWQGAGRPPLRPVSVLDAFGTPFASAASASLQQTGVSISDVTASNIIAKATHWALPAAEIGQEPHGLPVNPRHTSRPY